MSELIKEQASHPANPSSPESTAERHMWWLILGVVLLLRTAWAIAVPVIPTSDSHAYDVFAQNIATGLGYGWEANKPNAFWPVGTSAIYAGLYFVFGHSFTAIILLNITISVATTALAMDLAKRWFNTRCALSCGWILALWPLLIQYTTILASELLFNFFVLAAFWFSGVTRWSLLRRATTTGTAMAFACYVRPVALLLLPLVFLAEYSTDKGWRRLIAATAIAGIVMAAIILPWTARNYRAFGQFVLISSNAGSNFWMGNNPSSDGLYMTLPLDLPGNEVLRDDELKRRAMEFSRQHPIDFLQRTLGKIAKSHDRETIGIIWNQEGLQRRFGDRVLQPLKIISSIYWYLILAAAIIGSAHLTGKHQVNSLNRLVPIGVWAYFTALYGITVAGDRYHVSSLPFIAMLAAYAMTGLIQKRSA